MRKHASMGSRPSLNCAYCSFQKGRGLGAPSCMLTHGVSQLRKLQQKLCGIIHSSCDPNSKGREGGWDRGLRDGSCVASVAAVAAVETELVAVGRDNH
jgi:hypothetical protein